MDPATMQMLAQLGMGAASTAVPGVAVAQGVLGGIQTAVSLAKLAELNKQGIPKYDGGQQLKTNIGMYQNAMNTGLPQSFSNIAKSQQANQQASAYRQIQDASGGQLGSAFGRVAGMNQNSLGLSLAQMNDQYKQAMMNHLSNARTQLQAQNNMETNAARQYYMQQQQAYGGALQAGTHNLTTAIDYAKWPNSTQPGTSEIAQNMPATPQPVAQEPIANNIPYTGQFNTTLPAANTQQPVNYSLGDNVKINGGALFSPLYGSVKPPKLTYP